MKTAARDVDATRSTRDNDRRRDILAVNRSCDVSVAVFIVNFVEETSDQRFSFISCLSGSVITCCG